MDCSKKVICIVIAWMIAIGESSISSDENGNMTTCGAMENMEMNARTAYFGKPWPKGRVPYVLHRSVTGSYKETFYKAVNDFHSHTCVRFVPKTSNVRQYVTMKVIKETSYCGNAVLCHNGEDQWVEIAENCANSLRTWVHELAHTLCLGHEQKRKDRDEFLSYEDCQNPNEIDQIYDNQQLRGHLYDYNSVTSYPCWGGCWGNPKLELVDGCGGSVNKGGLSVLDIDKVNDYYGCRKGCFRHRWYNVNQLTNSHMKSLVNFASRDGDHEPVYVCRGYVFGDIVMGRYLHKDKVCQLAWATKPINVTRHIQVLALPGGSNTITPASSLYKLVKNTEHSTHKDRFLATGRKSLFNSKMYIAVGEIERTDGKKETVVGWAVDGDWEKGRMIVPQGHFHLFERFNIVACGL